MSRRERTWSGRRDPWKAAFFGLAAAALIAGVAWALLGSSLLVVRSVRISGAGAPRARVLAAAGIRLGTPLIRIDTGAIARRVERIRQVKSARVTRSWPDAVVIWTSRRTAVFALAAYHGFDLVDSYGVVLSWAARAPAGLVTLKPASPPAGLVTPKPASLPARSLRHDPAVLAAGTVVRDLPPWLRQRVSAVRAAGPANVILILRGGATVRWGGPERPAAKASEVAILLRTKAAYYDVSDPGTAVTGHSGQAGQASQGGAGG